MVANDTPPKLYLAAYPATGSTELTMAIPSTELPAYLEFIHKSGFTLVSTSQHPFYESWTIVTYQIQDRR